MSAGEAELLAAIDRDEHVSLQNVAAGFQVRMNVRHLTANERAKFNAAVSAHSNIKFFCRAALNAPSLSGYNASKIRIHQKLKAAGWDINKAVAVHDLGVPALNIGSKVRGTGDFGATLRTGRGPRAGYGRRHPAADTGAQHMGTRRAGHLR